MSRCELRKSGYLSDVALFVASFFFLLQRKSARLSNSVDTPASGNKRDSDPFECPSFLKQKRILMIGDSIDRRVLES